MIPVTAGPNFTQTTKTVALQTDADGDGAVTPDDTLRYTVVIRNTGNQNAAGLVFTDSIPANTAYAGNLLATSGTAVYSSGQIEWNGGIDANQSVTITFDVTVNTGITAGTVISNQGKVNYDSDGDGTNDKEQLTDGDTSLPGEQPTDTKTGVAGIVSTKSVADENGGNVEPGDILLYTVDLKNQSGFDVAGLEFVDAIPANTAYVAASVTATAGTTVVSETPTLRIQNIAVPAHGQLTVTFRVQVNNPLPAGVNQISNQGTVNYDSNGDGINDRSQQTDGDTVTPGEQPTVIPITAGPNFTQTTKTVTLRIDADGDGAVTPDDTLRYTVVIRNTGNQNAAGLVFTDSIPANTAYAGNLLSTSGTAVYSSGQIEWNGSIDANQSVTVTFDVTVNTGIAAGTVLSNQGKVNYDSDGDGTNDKEHLTDGDTSLPGEQPTDTKTGVAGIVSTKGVKDENGGNVEPGDILLYTVSLLNKSGFAISGAEFVDSIPAHTAYVATSVSTPSGTVESESPVLRIQGISLPAHGEIAITFRVQVVNPIPAGVNQISNQGTVNYDSNGDGSNDRSQQTDGDTSVPGEQPTIIPVVAGPDFESTKSVALQNDADGNTVVTPGDTLRYTVEIRNIGNQDSSGTVQFYDNIPAFTAYFSGSVNADAGTASYNSGSNRIEWSGNIAAGGSVNLVFDVTVNSGIAVGTLISNQGVVNFDSDGDGVNDSEDLTDGDSSNPGDQPTDVPVGGTPEGIALKTVVDENGGSVQPGDVLTYTVTMKNTSSFIVKDLEFTDSIPANTTYVPGSVVPPSGSTVEGETPVLRITGIDFAAFGENTVVFSVKVDDPLPAGVSQISNQGLVYYDSDGNGNNDSSQKTDGDPAQPGEQPTVVPLTAGPMLAPVSKSAELLTDADGNSAVSPGDTLRYTVIITNSGNAAASDVHFTDTPDVNTTLTAGSVITNPAGLTVISGNQTGDTSVDVEIGILNGGGQSVVITFDVIINEDFPVDVEKVANQGIVESTELPDTRTDDPNTPEADDETVTPVKTNDPPDAVDDSASTPLNTPVSVPVLVNDSDPDNDAITVVSVTQPDNGSVSFKLEGTVIYTSDPGYTGFDTFTYTIEDGHGGSDTATVTINVDDHAPTAVADSGVTRPDTPITIPVLNNDTDPDNDVLTVTAVTDPPHGSVTKNPDGTVTYIPDTGFTGTDTFEYTIVDATGNTAKAIVSVLVDAEVPAAADDAETTPKNTPVTVDVLNNDSDPDNDPLTIKDTDVTDPANGTVTVDNNGTPNDPSDDTLIYTPDEDYVGADYFTYTVCDPDGNCDRAAVTIIVDDLPEARPDTNTAQENGPAVTGNVLNNDYPGNPVTTVTAANQNGTAIVPGTPFTTPAGGSLTLNADGTYSYTPPTWGYVPPAGLSEVFVYTITDADGDTSTSTLTVTVFSGNRPPVAEDDSTATNLNTPVDIAVLPNDSDPDGDPLTVTDFTQPGNGTVVLSPDGTFTYTPNPGFTGTDTFTYTIDDGRGGYDSAVVTITLKDNVPLAVPDTAITQVNTPVDITVLSNDKDPDNDPLTVTAVTDPPHGTAVVNPDGTVTYTPDTGYTGTDTFTYTICDTHSNCVTADVSVTVYSYITGLVYHDLNGSSIQDSEEQGISGVKVELLDATGAVIASAVTDENGSYIFPDILPGDYTVRETDLSGYTSTTPNEVSVSTADTGSAEAVFGDQRPAVISGLVFEDKNGNGVQDEGENGIPGVAVELTDSTGQVIASVISGEDGRYAFDPVNPGNYTVKETDPEGYISTTGNSVDVTLPDGGTAPVNFGDQKKGSISGIVFNDVNGDGVRDSEEPGISGVNVELLDSEGNLIAATVTSPEGTYSFADVPAGAYVVKETDPEGYVSTTGNTVPVNLVSGTEATASFGDRIIGSISGTVFNDVNGDGVISAGETGIPGVTVELLTPDGAVIATTVTGGNGSYSFTDIPAGAYIIRETDPEGYVSTTGNTVPINLTAEGGASANFGDQKNGTVSGTVFHDINGDGIQNSGEPGIAGVTVELRDIDGNLVATILTDSSGSYVFTEIPAGAYIVKETDPEGFVSTTANTVPVNLGSGGAATASFGDQNWGSISGMVFADANGDGILNGSETGLGGVTVELINAQGQVIATTVTAGDGTYMFTDVQPGSYTVRETDPEGFVSTTINTVPVNLVSGGSGTASFGDQAKGTLSGTVFNDSNGDGIQNSSEPGIGGVVIQLADSQGNVIASALTAGDGSYVFTNLQTGNYTVSETDPDGFISTTDNDVPVMISSGGSASANFGDQQKGTVSGIVFVDSNGDGILNNDEKGLGGVTVELTDANGNVIASAVTAGDGSYIFINVVPGDYTVRETDPEGFTSTTPNSVPVTLVSGGAATASFGDQQQGVISGVVFHDINGDGEQNANEDGISGVTVELTDKDGQVIASAVTAGDGSYIFVNIPPGEYTVKETDPAGFTSTTDNSVSVSIVSGGSAAANFGDKQSGSITGIVYYDKDGKCEYDYGKPGIGGVVIELRDADGNVIASTVTAGDGSYAFVNIPPGIYTVMEVEPEGYASSSPNVVWVTVPANGAGTANFCEQTGIPLLPDLCNTAKVAVDINGGALMNSDVIWYGVSLYNGGNSPATDVMYTDVPGDSVTVVKDSVVTSKGTVVSGQNGEAEIAVNIGTVAPGESIVISYYVQVRNDVPKGGWIVNQGHVSGSNIGDEPTDNPNTSALNDPTVSGPVSSISANLDIITSITSDASANPRPGDLITWQITLTNNGESSEYNPAGTSIELFNGYRITFRGTEYHEDGNSTWRYFVEEMSGAKDLSNWILELPSCIKVLEATPGFEQVSPDPNTGLSGLKWNTDDGFSSGEFFVTVQGHWQKGVVHVAAKSRDIGTGQMAGPACVASGIADIYLFNGIPDYTTMVPGSLKTSTGTGVEEDVLKVAVENFAPGESVTITYTVKVNEDIPEGYELRNQGYILGAGEPVSVDNHPQPQFDENAEVPTEPGTGAIIEAYESIVDYNGGTFYPGDAVEYNITIMNSGGETSEKLLFSDTIEGFVSLIPGTVSNSAGEVKTGNNSGDTSVVVEIGTMAPGEKAVITFQAMISGDAPNGVPLSNQGIVSSYGLPDEKTDDPYTCTPNLPTVAVVMWDPNAYDPPAAEKRFSGEFPVVHWELTWINDKNESALLVYVEDDIPQGVSYVDGSLGADFGDFRFDANTNKVVWEGSIPGQGGRVSIWYDTTVPENMNLVENRGCAVWDQNGNGQWEDEAAESLISVCTDDPGTLDPDDGTVWKRSPLSLGDTVWIDDNKDGIWQTDREKGVDGVKVSLYADADGNGDFTPGVDQFLKTMTTATRSGVQGYYLFEDLSPGSYIVQIAPESFSTGVLKEYVTSPGEADPDNNVDNDDNGYEKSGHGVVSRAITLDRDQESVNDGDTDPNTNRTVDFGFVKSESQYIWPLKPF
ncbi:MAG: SdrD B-like domain-containing protein [Desulfococcaceae bacterium]